VVDLPLRVIETLAWVAVGFNPFRQQKRSYADYVLVAAAVVICIALVAWALFG
jgi:hypothetical protein